MAQDVYFDYQRFDAMNTGGQLIDNGIGPFSMETVPRVGETVHIIDSTDNFLYEPGRVIGVYYSVRKYNEGTPEPQTTVITNVKLEAEKLPLYSPPTPTE